MKPNPYKATVKEMNGLPTKFKLVILCLITGFSQQIMAAGAAVLPGMNINPNITTVGKPVKVTSSMTNSTNAIVPTASLLYRGVTCGRAPYGLVINNNVKLSFSNPNSIATGACSVGNWYSSYMVGCSIQNLSPNETATATFVVTPSEKNRGQYYNLGTCVLVPNTATGVARATLTVLP
ncbi:MAG: hypothetical protein HOO87_09440 [Methyloglobulus sp.]|nr:hypothetical protein [Methyloglobulus sp.]